MHEQGITEKAWFLDQEPERTAQARQQFADGGASRHQRDRRAAGSSGSVIRPTLGAPARCSSVITVTTEP